MFKNFLKACDFIGVSVKLKYEKGNNYKSLLGGVLSIAIMCISLAASISFGWTMIFKTNFTVSLSKSRETQAFVNLTNNFPFMVGISRRGGVIIPELQKYANISFITYNLERVNGTPVKTIKYLNSRNCQSEDFNNMTDNFISVSYSSNMTYFSCLQQNQEMSIYGNIGSSNFTFVNILVDKCINGTGIVCMPNAKIDELFTNLFISIFFRDSYFENINYTHPEQYYANQFAIPISNTVYKRQYLYLKNINFISDYGLIFEDKQQVNTYQLESMNSELYFTKDAAFTPNTIMELSITTKNIKDVYYRSYYKLQNLAADLGGVLKIVLLLFSFFNKMVSERILDNQIYNKLFPSLMLSNKNSNDSKNPTIFKTNNIFNTYKTEKNNNNERQEIVNSKNTLINTFSKNILNLKQNKNNQKNMITLHNNNFSIGSPATSEKKQKRSINYADFICFCFIDKSKRQQLKFVKDVVHNLMDIRTILKNMNNCSALIEYVNKKYFDDVDKIKSYQRFPVINTDIIKINKNKSILDYNKEMKSHLQSIISSHNNNNNG